MPRTGRGGKQPKKTASGQEHGKRVEQERAMDAVPLPQVPGTSVAPVPPPVSFSEPTQRPEEPVTAGLAVGPGPGPEALAGMAGGPQSIVDDLRGLYRAFPNEDVRRLLEFAERRLRPSETGFR